MELLYRNALLDIKLSYSSILKYNDFVIFRKLIIMSTKKAMELLVIIYKAKLPSDQHLPHIF